MPCTTAIVADRLRAWGVEVAEGVGGHGVVGTIHGQGGAGPNIDLRADMDALPIEEAIDVSWRSRASGRMHACGHDGHTAMLLGAARHLAATRAFEGTARVIFQPGEKGAGGALAMLADRLFDRFPCDAIYGLHNSPGASPRIVRHRAGPFQWPVAGLSNEARETSVCFQRLLEAPAMT